MKKYINPELEVELFDGRDLYDYATDCNEDITCRCYTGGDVVPECPMNTRPPWDPPGGGDGGGCLPELG